MWHDEGAWIAVGVSALFVVVGLVMHRVFVRILKNGATEPERKENHE
jgi:heme exporter protein D